MSRIFVERNGKKQQGRKKGEQGNADDVKIKVSFQNIPDRHLGDNAADLLSEDTQDRLKLKSGM
jgi:hypothetical protein